jgi:hypothetical protein
VRKRMERRDRKGEGGIPADGGLELRSIAVVPLGRRTFHRGVGGLGAARPSIYRGCGGLEGVKYRPAEGSRFPVTELPKTAGKVAGARRRRGNPSLTVPLFVIEGGHGWGRKRRKGIEPVSFTCPVAWWVIIRFLGWM